jgi:hypothetical protein
VFQELLLEGEALPDRSGSALDWEVATYIVFIDFNPLFTMRILPPNYQKFGPVLVI